jgi:mono/diheme cytochrome c family protein
MNEHFAGNWTLPRWQPSEEIQHCVECHGPDAFYIPFKAEFFFPTGDDRIGS